MTTTIQLRLEGLSVPFTARSWRIRNHLSDFEPLPDDATTLHVLRNRGLFINRKSDRRPQELSVEDARHWGTDDENDTELIFAQAKTPSARYCVRMALNVGKFFKRKRSNRYRALDRLIEDAKFHSNHLGGCEGWIVPFHYGMWIMDTGDWAGQVLLSITQWCGISWHELSYTKMNTEANRILVGRTFEVLHDSGFEHGDLRGEDGFRHVIIDIHAPGLSHEDLLNGKAPCYLVGFSEGQKHRCARKVPVLPLGSYLSVQDVGCEEIADVLLLIKFMKNTNTRVSASRALEWHSTYSGLHPDQDNVDVTIAQRKRLYSDLPPVYPDHLEVSFDGEDEYAKVVIRRIDMLDTLDFNAAELSHEPVDSDEETEQPPERLDTFRSDSSSPEPGIDETDPIARKLALVSLDTPFASKV
ncbi:hypothetical protein C8R47DRAFT_1321448 [Mycena vitilis]|nr:hypothetical protein C8R47DRAFT_1321448 [Mycena vitilis]